MMPPVDKDDILKSPRGDKLKRFVQEMIGEPGQVEALHLHAMREMVDRGYAMFLLDGWNNPSCSVPTHERGEEPCDQWLAMGYYLTIKLLDAMEDVCGVDEL